MKKVLLLIAAAFTTTLLSAQVQDSVSMGAGSPSYPLDVYYNMSTGAKDTVRNTNWHLAFSVRNVQPPNNVLLAATVRINEARGVTVYKSSQSLGNWTNFDTTNWRLWPAGKDSDSSWDVGALNQGRTNGFDFGWGDYNMTSHHVDGKAIFLVRIANGSSFTYKKLMITQLTLDTTWNFTFANLDGSDSTAVSFNKATYANKFFAYYNLVSKTFADREPVRSGWDLLFTRYVAKVSLFGVDTFYAVSGVLTNPLNVTTARVSGVHRDSSNRSMVSAYSPVINTIGWDWKISPMGPPPPTWPIADSLTFFVKKGNIIYKMLFDKFAANPNNIVFNKSSVDVTAVSHVKGMMADVQLYPNPAKDYLNIVAHTKINSSNATVSIIDMTGRTILSLPMSKFSGGFESRLNLTGINKGVYFYQIITSEGQISGRFIIE